MLGQHVFTKFNSEFNEIKIDCDVLFRRVNYLQTLIDHFWNKWRREYLTELRECHKLTNVISDRQIKLNKVIIIEETRVPRLR